jgi:hypothetical protein
MRRAFGRKRIYISSIQKRMFFLAFATSFVAVFTQTLAVLIDNVIVCAFFSEAEIASVILANPFFYLLEIPAAGLGAGIQAVCVVISCMTVPFFFPISMSLETEASRLPPASVSVASTRYLPSGRAS